MTHLQEHQASLRTEEDIASYLISNPAFFERFAEVLGAVQLASPHGGKTVSLHERQTSMLREKIKGLEATIVEMMGYGSENMQIIEQAHAWTQAMLKERDPLQLPAVLTAQLQVLFDVPNVYLRLWDLDAPFGQMPEVLSVVVESKGHIASLPGPYCGPRGSVEGLRSLAGQEANLDEVQSIAILPLRAGAIEDDRITFGYLLLTSPDSHRFKHEMGKELLVRLASLASAALQRLLSAETVAWLKEQERLARQQDGQSERPPE